MDILPLYLVQPVLLNALSVHSNIAELLSNLSVNNERNTVPNVGHKLVHEVDVVDANESPSQ